MLADEIENAARTVRTDAYQMSVGEVVSMYEREEIVIHPEFQRLFRWEVGQKSKLIESLLLGIPLPPIFVFEKDDGAWELVDGLQRISTILEFMGILRTPERDLVTPSVFEATKYLPSLHNAVWDRTDRIADILLEEQKPLDKAQQLSIRRARIGVEILKRPSDEATKYDLFQRLNAGGTLANPQELRNCIMLMVNPDYYRTIKEAAESEDFISVFRISDHQRHRARHLELAIRFLVHCEVPYDGLLDVEEYMDEGAIALCERDEGERDAHKIKSVVTLLSKAAGKDVLRRQKADEFTGKAGLVGLEVIAVGVASNLEAIQSQPNPVEYVRDRIEKVWSEQTIVDATAPGLRGTVRIQRTVPFGIHWFSP